MEQDDMYQIEVFLVTHAADFDLLGEANIYTWVQLPGVKFDTFQNAIQMGNNIIAQDRRKGRDISYRIKHNDQVWSV